MLFSVFMIMGLQHWVLYTYLYTGLCLLVFVFLCTKLTIWWISDINTILYTGTILAIWSSGTPCTTKNIASKVISQLMHVRRFYNMELPLRAIEYLQYNKWGLKVGSIKQDIATLHYYILFTLHQIQYGSF